MAVETTNTQNSLKLGQSSRVRLVIACVGLILAGVVKPGISTLIVIGIVPTLPIVLLFNGKSRSYAYACIGAPCIAFLFYLVLSDWHSIDSAEGASRILTSGYNFYMFVGCVIFGWGTYFCVPMIIFRAIVRAVNKKIISKQKFESELIREWGPEVTADAPVMIRPFNGHKYRKKYASKPAQKQARLDQWEQTMLEYKDGLEIDSDCLYTDADTEMYVTSEPDDYEDALVEQIASAVTNTKESSEPH